MITNGLPGSELPKTGERRRYVRIGEPELLLRFAGEVHAARSWSLGGALIEGYGGGLGAGALLTIDGVGCREADLQPTRVPARVVRADVAGGRISVSFLVLDDSAYAVLTDLMHASGVHGAAG